MGGQVPSPAWPSLLPPTKAPGADGSEWSHRPTLSELTRRWKMCLAVLRCFFKFKTLESFFSQNKSFRRNLMGQDLRVPWPWRGPSRDSCRHRRLDGWWTGPGGISNIWQTLWSALNTRALPPGGSVRSLPTHGRRGEGQLPRGCPLHTCPWGGAVGYGPAQPKLLAAVAQFLLAELCGLQGQSWGKQDPGGWEDRGEALPPATRES